MALQRDSVVGDYRVEDVLGRGATAIVYSARHVELDRQVALKVLADGLGASSDFVGRFQREGRLQASLEHPHAVTVYDAGESEHGLYLAMQLVPGATLAELIGERELSAARALGLLRQVADALDAIHAAGLVHRDVKPQNVLVGGEDDAYLGDFGLSRAEGGSGVTAAGRLVGTIPYLAPELIRGDDATPASDRYAFAATVFECLTGTVVFPRRSEAAMLAAHASEPPPAISGRRAELPAALDPIFERALAKAPSDRFGSARALVDAVAGALDGSDLGSPNPTVAALEAATAEPRVRPESSPPRRALIPWLAAAALAGAAVALAVVALVGGDDNEPVVTVPPPLAGTTVLGSDLSQVGRTVNCSGEALRPDSPGCVIAQADLPGRTLVVPRDGVVRRWSVRSARGELSLAVLRPHSTGTSQVARSRDEFAENDGVFAFATDLNVQRGDRLGLVALDGSGIGIGEGVKGATTDRWISGIQGEQPPTHPPGTGLDDELLLRVEYIPGGQQRLPHQVTGPAAATLPAGKVERSRSLDYTKGPPVKIDLVALGERYVLDEFVRGRRTARVDVPGFVPGDGDVVTFDAYAEEAGAGLGVYIEYVAVNSARVQNHFYAVFPHEFQFVN